MSKDSQEEVPFLLYDRSVDKREEYPGLTDDSDDVRGKNSAFGPKGLSVMKTTIFLLGETAGTGVLALPHAMEAAGYSGLPLTLVAGLVTMYTSILLGRCLLMIRDSHPEFRGHVRHPYAVIGQLAFGTPGRVVVSVCGNVHLFSSTVVFLVLGSQTVQNLLENLFHVHLSFCYIQFIFVAILLPMTWLGSPKDMWYIGSGAGLTTLTAVILLLYILVRDGQQVESLGHVKHNTPAMLGALQAIGVINFAYGGHSGYPVLQCDMKDPAKWNIASCAAFTVMIILYTTVGFGGFLVYGANVDGNVLMSASPGPVLYMVQILITLHLFCGFITVINPVLLEVEELLKIRKEFSWRRMASRSSVVCLSLFLAQTVPKFDALAALVGATGPTTLSFVGPPLLYLRLRKTSRHLADEPVALYVQTVMVEIALVSIVLGLVAGYSAISSLYSPGSLTTPCYLMG